MKAVAWLPLGEEFRGALPSQFCKECIKLNSGCTISDEDSPFYRDGTKPYIICRVGHNREIPITFDTDTIIGIVEESQKMLENNISPDVILESLKENLITYFQRGLK